MTGNEPTSEHDGRLAYDLRELRGALSQLRAPGNHEDALRKAFRARRRATRAERKPVRPRWGSAPALAIAAVFVSGIGIGVLAGLDRERAPRRALPVENSAALTVAPGAFQALPYGPGFSPSGSYTVVRVRIPLSALAIAHSGALDGTIEADLLLGEDGLASGIRFDAEDTLLVSTISR